MTRPATLQSVEKCVRVLETFMQFRSATATLSEVADALGWSLPATHQYLATLAHCGWLQQDAKRHYRLSVRAATFGRFAATHAGIPEVVTRQMRALVEKLGEPISFAVRNGDGALIVERFEPQRPLSVRREAERLLPLGSTSGQVLLAFDRHATEDETRPYAEAIEEIRAQGYSVHRAVWMDDAIEVIAVPVLQSGECLGALSVIAPEGRMALDRAIEELTAARRIMEEELNSPRSG